jgi:hypothetical protein
MRIGDASIQWSVIASQRKESKTGLLRRFAPRNDGKQLGDPMPANRNIMFLIIDALIVVVGVLGYNPYQTKKQPEGLQINVGPSGLKIQNK